jgi:hypothetical protein
VLNRSSACVCTKRLHLSHLERCTQ